MKIGIIGTGNIGGTLARKLREAGHDIRVANSRGVEGVRQFADVVGAQPVDVRGAVENVDAVILSIPLPAISKAPLRFSELERRIDGVNQKMLIQQLKELEKDGIVTRTAYPEVPPRVEYTLTDMGKALGPSIEALVDWAFLRCETSDERSPARESV